MTQEEIIEGNKLIAKFIDLTPHNMFPDELQAPFGFEWIATNVNIRAMYAKEDNEFTSFEDLFLFHSSWDWLMPVCIKLGMIFVNTNIVLTYNNVLNGIRSLEKN